MILYAFGDSWTEGVGGNLNLERTTEGHEERTRIRHLTCWPKYLSDLLEISFVNMGVGGSSNKIIFDSVISMIKNDTIKTNDLVIIMWSSSLRDEVPFFPKDEFHFWGKRYKQKEHIFKNILRNPEINNQRYKRFEKEYKEFFILEVFNESYYDIINQNYIIFLEQLFKKFGINYLFCDAFESVISKNLVKELDKTHLIDKSRYWKFMESDFREFLMATNRKDVWEDGSIFSESFSGKHPSKNGYKLIAEEMNSFITKNDLIKENKVSYFNIL